MGRRLPASWPFWAGGTIVDGVVPTEHLEKAPIRDKDMKAKDKPYPDRRQHLTVALCLLLIQPLALARSDQVHKALMQAEASL
jgi:hypothetical protein